MEKICKKCGESKGQDQFYLDKGHLSSPCKECRRKSVKERTRRLGGNPEWKKKEALRVSEWKKNHQKETFHTNQKWRNRIRMECLNAYGGKKPKCICCGEDEIKFLAIDHMKGGGNKHKQERKQKGENQNIFQWLKKNNYPTGYQILCHNCNLAKGYYGECPHKLKIK